MADLVTLDIGGTNARFALASVAADGSVQLGEAVTLQTGAFPSLEAAWSEFASRQPGGLPRATAIAFAGPVSGGAARLTNSSWEIRTDELARTLELDKVTLLNDFAAVAHAANALPPEDFLHLTGPEVGLPHEGTISVIGPGTGLGVAHFRRIGAVCHVQATEGGHIGFAPVDDLDDRILARLRHRHDRVSLERVVSGPGIAEIYAVLPERDAGQKSSLDADTIWRLGIAGEDATAAAAVDHFCLLLGRAAGDIALAHGAAGVVIAGGTGLSLGERLRGPGFGEGFRAKGRYEAMMAGIPVKLLTHPQPGLLGAAAAFAAEHRP
jgi:glucokinase